MFDPDTDYAHPSFGKPIDDPGTAPTDSPLVCIRVSQSWLARMAGAMLQFTQPQSWNVAPGPALNDVLQRSYDLLLLVAEAKLCMPLQIELTTACGEQFSEDGGVTWTPVTGWLDNFAACVLAIVHADTRGTLVMQPGVSSPPAPVWTPDGTDWVYSP